jgi:cytochrome c oxidase subunit 2
MRGGRSAGRYAGALALSACSGVQSALHTRGPGAARIADLWWFMLVVAAAIYLVVLAVLLGIILRRERSDGERSPESEASERRRNRWLVVAGVTLPAIVLAVVFVVTFRTQAALHPESEPDLTVQVIGRQWWWEIRYPGRTPSDAVITANELHIPIGRRVRVEGTSTDVIHSIWVPNLHGKTDLVPGRTTVTWLQADRPGVSRGQCAEYCGIQHARMALLVVAQRPEEFARWLDEQRRPAAAPADEASRRGQSVFLASGCGYCHAVRGTRTVGLVAPDLTHFASRRTIAAGTLINTRGHLAGWIADPQAAKPGNLMPRVPLAPDDLLAVVSYLQGLR